MLDFLFLSKMLSLSFLTPGFPSPVLNTFLYFPFPCVLSSSERYFSFLFPLLVFPSPSYFRYFSCFFSFYGWLPFSAHSTFTPDFLSHLTNILHSFSYLSFSFSSHRSFPAFPNTLLPPKEAFQNLFLIPDFLSPTMDIWHYASLKGHGNEPDFPRFLHKSVRHRSP